MILNLPNSMAKAGLPLGTFFQLWTAVVSLYTLWLLSHLYQEFKRRAVSDTSVGLLPLLCWALGLTRAASTRCATSKLLYGVHSTLKCQWLAAGLKFKWTCLTMSWVLRALIQHCGCGFDSMWSTVMLGATIGFDRQS